MRTSLNKFKRTLVGPGIFLDHGGTNGNQETSKYGETNKLPANPWHKGVIKREINKVL